MTNDELRDSIAKDVYLLALSTSVHEDVRPVVEHAFSIADAFMAERAKRGSWNDLQPVEVKRSYIGQSDA